MTHDDYALWDGAYVLGALSTADRLAFEDHLRECPGCSAAVAELTVLPGLLGSVPREIALAEPEIVPIPAAGRDERLFSVIRSHRRRTRARDAAIAVAAAVAIAVPVGLLVQHTPDAGQDAVAKIQMVDVQPTVIDAEAAITPHPWGTTVSLACTYTVEQEQIPELYGTETEEYALTVTEASGRITRLATWIGSPGETVTPTATISAPVDSIVSVDVRATDSGEVLLTAPV